MATSVSSDTPTTYADMTLERAVALVDGTPDEEMIHKLHNRVMSIVPEQQRFREWCIRADKLYYAENFYGPWGADLWPEDPSATTPGRAHVSVNTPPVYVDVPAALQAVPPVEKMIATDTTDEARDAASQLSRIFEAWKRQDGYDLKFHKATTVKALYGRTAAKVYWDTDDDKKYPCVDIVEQPRNLHLGYRTNDYNSLEWAAYVQLYTPEQCTEEFGVDIGVADMGGTVVPYVAEGVDYYGARPARNWLVYGPARIEVWDFWYRQAIWRGTGSKRKFVRFATMNVVVAGNKVVQGPNEYPEYGGDIPYIPVFNTYIPGLPDGRPELYDMEPLIREKWERITSGSQMIADGTSGQFWQLTGAEAPYRVPGTVKPKRNEVVGPGPGNRIEAITPFIAQFELGQYLGIIDRESAEVSGLNDLLLGLAPSSVLSSSKAVNALIANYESRIQMRRALLYQWRRSTWELVLKVWQYKASKDKVEPSLQAISLVVAKGSGYLQIEDPSLSPKDELETMTRAINGLNAKVFSQRRAMSLVGVDDPETEQALIREERTDATLFPQDVQVMAQLMSALQSLGLQANQATQGQAQDTLNQGQSDLQKALGAATPNGTPGQQGSENPPILPPGGQAPPPGGVANPQPFAQPPAGGAQVQPGRPGGPALLQSVIKGGKLGGATQIKTQASLGRR